jgi:hypothetical protein
LQPLFGLLRELKFAVTMFDDILGVTCLCFDGDNDEYETHLEVIVH